MAIIDEAGLTKEEFLNLIKKEAIRPISYIRWLVEIGAAELEKQKAAKLYMEGKISISGAAEAAKLTVPEIVDYLVCKGFQSEYRWMILGEA